MAAPRLGVREAPGDALVARVRSLDGVAAEALASALAFWAELNLDAGRLPLVGLSNDGGVAFEWELSGGRSVYSYAEEAGVVVAAFDDEHDHADLRLSPSRAACVVRALLDEWR
jgi:hypothetical protein